MRRAHIILAILYAYGFTLAPVQTVMADTNTKQKASCPQGYSLNLTGAQGHVYCLKKLKQSYREYYTYTPCFSPGEYKSNDEVPDGPAQGRDRCTAFGVSGPSVPCSIDGSAKREIHKGRQDACYKENNRYVDVYADVILIN